MGNHAPMTRAVDVIVVSPERPLVEAWQIMTQSHIRHLPVVRAGALIGMISDRDILARGSLDEAGQLRVGPDVIVGDAMTPTPLETCEADTDIAQIAHQMTQKKIDAVPVVRGLRLVGLVTSTDLLNLLLEQSKPAPLPFEFRLIEDPRAYA